MFLCISSTIFPFLLFFLWLLLVFVFAFVFLSSHRNVQRHGGWRAGGTGPFLFTVTSFWRPGWKNRHYTIIKLNFIQPFQTIFLYKTPPYLAVSEAGDDTAAFFSFFPDPGPLVPLLCFGEPLDFLDKDKSLELNCSGETWRKKVRHFR